MAECIGNDSRSDVKERSPRGPGTWTLLAPTGAPRQQGKTGASVPCASYTSAQTNFFLQLWCLPLVERNRLQHVLHGNSAALPAPHADFLASLPVEQQRLALDLITRASFPPDPAFCSARVYRGAAQCRRRPQVGALFCPGSPGHFPRHALAPSLSL